MPAPQIRLNAAQKEDLAVTCELGASVLQTIADKLERAKFTIRRSQIEQTIQDVVGAERGVILARVLFGIASTFRRAFFSADDALEQVTQSLGSARREDVRFQKWDECRASLRKLLETRSISLAAKALDISYDFERIYLAGRILTSVRPVFDDQRHDIIGSTIVQTLRLEFLAPNGDRSSITVAMDMEDIHKLKEECEHAGKKSEQAKERFEKDCGFDAIIPGEEVNE